MNKRLYCIWIHFLSILVCPFSAHEDQSVIFSTWNVVGSCYQKKEHINTKTESVELSSYMNQSYHMVWQSHIKKIPERQQHYV